MSHHKRASFHSHNEPEDRWCGKLSGLGNLQIKSVPLSHHSIFCPLFAQFFAGVVGGGTLGPERDMSRAAHRRVDLLEQVSNVSLIFFTMMISSTVLKKRPPSVCEVSQLEGFGEQSQITTTPFVYQ